MSKSIGSIILERQVDALFSRYTAAGSPGAAVAVMQGGTIALCKGYGLASIELGVPIGPTTRFRIASVSKQFTVTAALMFAAEGKLDLADPPHKYLPELPPLPITLDQMMRNASGLPDFLELLRLGGHGLDKPARPADLLTACVRNHHLNFTPGSRFLYSNSNFLLLGMIVEKVAKTKLGNLLAERIFKPLGMTRTMLVPEIDTVPARRRGWPHLVGRGPVDLEPALRPANAGASDAAGATCRRRAARRRAHQQIPAWCSDR
jgi:D-aminopeptidase